MILNRLIPITAVCMALAGGANAYSGEDYVVCNLDPNGDNFLAVRASTNAGAYELDRLGPGQGVHMCDSDGDWIGIVYDKSGELDCGTDTPVAEERDYEGPCESGWVSKRYVTLLAG